jgi:hypothetical protein
MEVLAVSSDQVFNYFFSIGVYWGFMMASFFAVLTLFRA